MNRAIRLLLVLSFLLGVGYAWLTPIGAAPDEGAHLEYVRVLAIEHRLPSLDLSHPRNLEQDANYEAHQSPAYYALAVPFYLAGRSAAGEPGAAAGCRALSLLIGVLGVYLIWLLARELAPERPALWTVAAGVAAFLPMRLHVVSSVSNDGLAEVASTLALLLMVRAVQGAWDTRRAVGLGAALALALLSKQSDLMLLPPALAAIYFATRNATGEPRDESSATPSGDGGFARQFFSTGLVMAVVLVALSGWWFARNHVLYGDFLGQKAFNWYFAGTPRFEDFRVKFSFLEYLNRLVLPTAFDTFWGAFGHLSADKPELFLGAYGEGVPSRRWGYPPPSWVYPLLLVATLAALAGGVRAWLQRRNSDAPPEEKPALAVLVLHAVFVVAVFFNFNALYFQAQGRYLFPALGTLSLGFAGGWLAWAPRRERVLSCVIVALLLLLAVYALFGVLGPGFGTLPGANLSGSG